MMTGWIKVTDENGSVYVNVDRIEYVVANPFQGFMSTIVLEGETLYVKEPINDVLKAIKLARPVRT